jgi:baculoviral IAP repeat-containing protein 6
LYSEIEALGDAIKDIDCYICVSETNIHMIKMLMIPDYDTPYGGGYFEFDMLIPYDYPNAPPKVRFLTTGGGSVRFNPNLYQCGKVCLSVLNTWSSNQWNPASSTLTQVVLSIFSMIFIEHPYTNEPCFYNALETKSGKTKSEAYNTRVRKDCANVAITGQLRNSTTPFKDIIEQHWRKQSQKTIEAYAKHGITIE